MLHYKKTEIHGHRGCRGYFPENTLQGFLHAATLDIDAIEMDVVISKDHEVVVSHELYMHRKKCLWPNLKPISKEQEPSLMLYQMNYEEIKTFDCGLLTHPNYPLVKASPAYKPLLKEVIEKVELAMLKLGKQPLKYNIEIKSEAQLIGKCQPAYDVYVDLILQVLIKMDIESRVIIQSFDKEMLKTINKMNPNIELSLLIEDQLDPLQHIEELGFVPHILASDFIYLNTNNILSLQNKNIKVFAFTVNQIADIETQLAMGVDAIITDYPDVAARCLNYYKYPEK